MIPLIENKNVGREITVDLDVWYEYFLRDKKDCPEDERPGINIGYIREQIILLEAKLDRSIFVQYRRSSKGHVHIRLIFDHDIAVFDAFLLRSCLCDDLVRHYLDEKRYALWGSLHEMNKCFDTKSESGGKVYVSGPWIPLSKDREDFTGLEKSDWEQYWESIGRQFHKGENHMALVRSHWKELTQKQKRGFLLELSQVLAKEESQTELRFGFA